MTFHCVVSNCIVGWNNYENKPQQRECCREEHEIGSSHIPVAVYGISLMKHQKRQQVKVVGDFKWSCASDMRSLFFAWAQGFSQVFSHLVLVQQSLHTHYRLGAGASSN